MARGTFLHLLYLHRCLLSCVQSAPWGPGCPLNGKHAASASRGTRSTTLPAHSTTHPQDPDGCTIPLPYNPLCIPKSPCSLPHLSLLTSFHSRANQGKKQSQLTTAMQEAHARAWGSPLGARQHDSDSEHPHTHFHRETHCELCTGMRSCRLHRAPDSLQPSALEDLQIAFSLWLSRASSKSSAVQRVYGHFFPSLQVLSSGKHMAQMVWIWWGMAGCSRMCHLTKTCGVS